MRGEVRTRAGKIRFAAETFASPIRFLGVAAREYREAELIVPGRRSLESGKDITAHFRGDRYLARLSGR